ncbi:MAG: hypothetical protein KJ000_15880 [Pirellulaceae bacterium]|nr:hypothetical protein [Pirellulaceae bacterium]
MRANLLTVFMFGLSMLAVSPLFAAEPSEAQQQEIELREKMAKLVQQARELKQAGNESQAKELMEQVGQLMREAKEAAQASDAQASDAQASDAQPREGGGLQERLQAAKNRIMELRREGRAEEAEALEREVREFMQQTQWKKQPAERPSGDDVDRRVHHLHVAADNLRAAGLDEQAEQLMQQAERIVAAARQAAPEREAPIRDLIEAVRRLNERVERLEQAVKKLMDAQQ